MERHHTRSPFRNDFTSPVHFDTHPPGLLSGLVFAGVNRLKASGTDDDGIMTAEEISFLPLENTDLVVLSACETGLGKVAAGEGLLGIQGAFQVSGARSTIAALWKVDDRYTEAIMARFYGNYLEKKMSKLDSLREAQLGSSTDS